MKKSDQSVSCEHLTLSTMRGLGKTVQKSNKRWLSKEEGGIPEGG